MQINQLAVPVALAVMACAQLALALPMPKTSPVHHATTANFCLDRKDEDYCSDARTMTRCRAGVVLLRSLCASGCDVSISGAVTCSNPASVPQP